MEAFEAAPLKSDPDVDEESLDDALQMGVEGESDADVVPGRNGSATGAGAADDDAQLGGQHETADPSDTPAKQLSSRFRGVCWNKKNKRWQAAINSQGRYLYLGSFMSEEEAARAFDVAAVKIRGAKAKLNFSFSDYVDSQGNLKTDFDPLALAKKVKRRVTKKAGKRGSGSEAHHLLGDDSPQTSGLAQFNMTSDMSNQEILQRAALILSLSNSSYPQNQNVLKLANSISDALIPHSGAHLHEGGNRSGSNQSSFAATLSSLMPSSRQQHQSQSGSELQSLLFGAGQRQPVQLSSYQQQLQQQQQQQQQLHQQQLHQQQLHGQHHHQQQQHQLLQQQRQALPSLAQRQVQLTLQQESPASFASQISSLEGVIPSSRADIQSIIYRAQGYPDRLQCALCSNGSIHDLGSYDSLSDAQQAALAAIALVEKVVLPGADHGPSSSQQARPSTPQPAGSSRGLSPNGMHHSSLHQESSSMHSGLLSSSGAPSSSRDPPQYYLQMSAPLLGSKKLDHSRKLSSGSQDSASQALARHSNSIADYGGLQHTLEAQGHGHGHSGPGGGGRSLHSMMMGSDHSEQLMMQQAHTLAAAQQLLLKQEELHPRSAGVVHHRRPSTTSNYTSELEQQQGSQERRLQVLVDGGSLLSTLLENPSTLSSLGQQGDTLQHLHNAGMLRSV